jgi:hypothetical protein
VYPGARLDASQERWKVLLFFLPGMKSLYIGCPAPNLVTVYSLPNKNLIKIYSSSASILYVDGQMSMLVISESVPPRNPILSS